MFTPQGSVRSGGSERWSQPAFSPREPKTPQRRSLVAQRGLSGVTSVYSDATGSSEYSDSRRSGSLYSEEIARAPVPARSSCRSSAGRLSQQAQFDRPPREAGPAAGSSGLTPRGGVPPAHPGSKLSQDIPLPEPGVADDLPVPSSSTSRPRTFGAGHLPPKDWEPWEHESRVLRTGEGYCGGEPTQPPWDMIGGGMAASAQDPYARHVAATSGRCPPPTQQAVWQDSSAPVSDLVFSMMDQNGDGVVSREEFARVASGMPAGLLPAGLVPGPAPPSLLSCAAAEAVPPLETCAREPLLVPPVPDPRDLFPTVRVPRPPPGQAQPFRAGRHNMGAASPANAEHVIQEQLQLLEEQLRIEAARQRQEVRQSIMEQRLAQQGQQVQGEAIDRCFARLDADGDGVLTRKEFLSGLQQEMSTTEKEEVKTMSAELARLRELNAALAKEKADLEAVQAKRMEEENLRQTEIEQLKQLREEAQRSNDSILKTLQAAEAKAAATRQRNLQYMDKQANSKDGALVARYFRVWCEVIVAAKTTARRKNEGMAKAMRLMSNSAKTLLGDCFSVLRSEAADCKRLREAAEMENRIASESEAKQRLEASASQDASSFHAKEQELLRRQQELERKQGRLRNDKLAAWETHFLGKDKAKHAAILVQWHGIVAQRKSTMDKKRQNMAVAVQHISNSQQGLVAALLAQWKHLHMQEKHKSDIEEAKRNLQAAKSAAGKAARVLQRQFAGSEQSQLRLCLDGWQSFAHYTKSCREKKEANNALIMYKIRQAELALLQVAVLAFGQNAGVGNSDKRLQEAHAQMEEAAAALEAERHAKAEAMQKQKDKHLAYYRKLHSSEDNGLTGECLAAWKRELEESKVKKKSKEKAFMQAQRAIGGSSSLMLSQSFGGWKSEWSTVSRQKKVKDKAFLKAQRMMAGTDKALLASAFSAWKGELEASKQRKKENTKAHRLAERAIGGSDKVLQSQTLQAWALASAKGKQERLSRTEAELQSAREDLLRSKEDLLRSNASSEQQAKHHRSENLRAHAAMLDGLENESLRAPLLAWRNLRQMASQVRSKKEHNLRIAERAISKDGKVLQRQSFMVWMRLLQEKRGGQEVERWQRRHSREAKKKLFLTDCINVQANRLLLSHSFAGWSVVTEALIAERRTEETQVEAAPDFFALADTNKDGVLTREELRNAMELFGHPGDASTRTSDQHAASIAFLEERIASEEQSLRLIQRQTRRQAEEVSRLRLLVALGADGRRCHRCDVGLTNLQTLVRSLTRVSVSVLAAPPDRQPGADVSEAILREIAAALSEAAPLDPRLAELSSYLQGSFADI